MKTYPELEKLKEVSKTSQEIGEFLNWLPEIGIYLCRYDEEDYFYRSVVDFEKLLAEYFKIDLNKVEQEKREILEDIRNNAEKKA